MKLTLQSLKSKCGEIFALILVSFESLIQKISGPHIGEKIGSLQTKLHQSCQF